PDEVRQRPTGDVNPETHRRPPRCLSSSLRISAISLGEVPRASSSCTISFAVDPSNTRSSTSVTICFFVSCSDIAAAYTCVLAASNEALRRHNLEQLEDRRVGRFPPRGLRNLANGARATSPQDAKDLELRGRGPTSPLLHATRLSTKLIVDVNTKLFVDKAEG